MRFFRLLLNWFVLLPAFIIIAPFMILYIILDQILKKEPEEKETFLQGKTWFDFWVMFKK